MQPTDNDFYINNTLNDMVDSFKYLGMTVFKNSNWYRSQKCLAKHASFALHNPFIGLRNIELPLLQQCSSFDS